MATDIISPSLYTLPIELLYRILDVLDNETILFRFGNVCQRFHSIAQTYNQYKLNFQSMSKPFFHSICRLISPENISSLILSDDNQTPEQIKLFLSLFHIEQFSRLRSLTLIEIEENDFHTLFSTQNILSSLSLTFRNHSFRNHQTLPLLSSIIANPNLRSLDLTLSSNKINELSWPNSCLLQSLILTNHLHFNQFSTILTHSIQLKKFVLQDCWITEGTTIDTKTSFPQLLSLTFDDSVLEMNVCQSILSLIPSLEHFHIVGGTNLSDGFRWEQFIQTKLLHLKKFEFAFCGNTDAIVEDSSNVSSLITAFQTSFWIEIKQWFVVCYYFKQSSNYSLYSLPICKANVRFYPHQDKIACSTSSNLNNDETSRNYVYEMQLNLTNLMTANDEDDEKGRIAHYPFFCKLKKLVLSVDDQWPVGSIEHLSTFIDLSSIVELSITIDFHPESISDTLHQLVQFFQQTPHLRSLTIDSSTTNPEELCAIIPENVKHLQISTKTIDEMKIIVQRLKQLNSVTFEHCNRAKVLASDFVTWLTTNRKQATCRLDVIYMSIWFDEIN